MLREAELFGVTRPRIIQFLYIYLCIHIAQHDDEIMRKMLPLGIDHKITTIQNLNPLSLYT